MKANQSCQHLVRLNIALLYATVGQINTAISEWCASLASGGVGYLVFQKMRSQH